MQNQLFNEIGEWAKDTFPDAGPEDHLRKLINEAMEAICKPSDILEFADCAIALIAAAYKAGHRYPDLFLAVEKKLEINKDRDWIKHPDVTYQHKNQVVAWE